MKIKNHKKNLHAEDNDELSLCGGALRVNSDIGLTSEEKKAISAMASKLIAEKKEKEQNK